MPAPVAPANPADPVDVVILMGVYDGADTLPVQLQSFADQTHPQWQVLAGDDGSRDASRALIEDFGQTHRATCLAGPGRGAAANFLFLAAEAGTRAPGSWIAFADQDDQWLPGKLSRAIAALQAVAPGQPALYCSRTWITDENLQGRRLSPPRPKPPGFANALVQNIAAGNTIVLNAAASRLISEAAREVTEKTGGVVVHDWWVYQVITGVGGVVIHDDEPSLLYRQHPANQIGANDHLRARARRIAMIFRGTWRAWNETNLAALRALAPRLSPENRAFLEDFAAARAAPLPGRVVRFARLGLYRQGLGGQIAMWLAIVLGRL